MGDCMASSDLLEALLTGRLPRNVRGPRLPRARKGAFPVDFELDIDGDPSDRVIDEIGLVCALDAPRWLRDVFVEQYALMPYASLRVEQCTMMSGRLGVQISFSTGGHSSSETVVEAVLGNLWLRSYLESERRGGHYVMVVPLEDIGDV